MTANNDPKDLSRRSFMQIMGLASVAGLGACTTTGTANAPGILGRAQQHVVIVGGGFGGATAAKYLKKFAPELKVTLIEYNQYYTTCPGSNWVLAGLRHVDSITFSYDDLKKKYDINVVQGWVNTIDTMGKNVRLMDGTRIDYTRLILSPGIDLKYDAIDGYEAVDINIVPHAWKAGKQTVVLKQQLASMRDGGTFVIAPPANPYRCPPGPYERVSMVAHYLKQHKPKSKILILDSKSSFVKQDRFEQGWKELYGYGTDKSMIEFVGGPEGDVKRIDVRSRTAFAGDIEESVRADVLNIIPPQEAGAIARAANVVDESGWCPVDQRTWESTRVKGVYIIGDAAQQDPMPKSGFAANTQAKVCAAAIATELSDKPFPEPSLASTCYSLIGPDYGISTAEVFKLNQYNKLIPTGGGVTPENGNFREEATYAENWWHNITQDIFS